MRILSALISIWLTATVATAQEATPDPLRKHQPAQLQEDFQALRNALEEGHGGLHHYTPKSELDLAFDAAAAQLDRPMDEREFRRLLLPAIALIHDGHTSLRPSEAYADHLSRQPAFLPFKLAFINGKAFLYRNYSDDLQFKLGGEVLAINGRAMAEIVDDMLPLFSSDGRNQSGKFNSLSGTTFFSTLHHLLYGPVEAFEFTYRPPADGGVKTVTAKGLTSERLTQRFNERYAEVAAPRPPIESDIDGNTATLTIRTFGGSAYQRQNIDYSGFLKKAFESYRDQGVKSLIIDVRGNGGGSDAYGKMVFAYLADKPFEYYRSLRVKRNQFEFYEYEAGSNSDPASRLSRNKAGSYDVIGHPNLGVQQPLTPRFSGKVYVLINGGSFSATSEFMSLVHHYGKAEFIGEESGGGYYGNTSGYSPRLVLPHTGLRINIPLVRYTMAVSGYPHSDRGVIPDYPVRATIEDLLTGRDPVLAFAKALAKARE